MICARFSCRAEFVPRAAGRPQRYCCKACRDAEQQAKLKAKDPVRYLARQNESAKRYRDSIREIMGADKPIKCRNSDCRKMFVKVWRQIFCCYVCKWVEYNKKRRKVAR